LTFQEINFIFFFLFAISIFLSQVKAFAPIGMLEYSIIPCGFPILTWPQKGAKSTKMKF